jgi:hypothetical protein
MITLISSKKLGVCNNMRYTVAFPFCLSALIIIPIGLLSFKLIQNYFFSKLESLPFKRKKISPKITKYFLKWQEKETASEVSSKFQLSIPEKYLVFSYTVQKYFT